MEAWARSPSAFLALATASRRSEPSRSLAISAFTSLRRAAASERAFSSSAILVAPVFRSARAWARSSLVFFVLSTVALAASLAAASPARAALARTSASKVLRSAAATLAPEARMAAMDSSSALMTFCLARSVSLKVTIVTPARAAATRLRMVVVGFMIFARLWPKTPGGQAPTGFRKGGSCSPRSRSGGSLPSVRSPGRSWRWRAGGHR